MPTLERIDACQQAGRHEEAERAIFEVLSTHFLVNSKEVKLPPGAVPEGVRVKQTDCKFNIMRFRAWLKTPEGLPYKKIGKGVSDDGLCAPPRLHCLCAARLCATMYDPQRAVAVGGGVL